MAAVRDSGSARRRGGSGRDGRVKTLAAQLNAELKAVFPHNAVEYFISYDDGYSPEVSAPYIHPSRYVIYKSQMLVYLLHVDVNIVSTRKTTIEIDEQLLERARAALGTATLKDTVDAAFREVLRDRARREEVEALGAMRGMDLDDDQVMAGAWRP